MILSKKRITKALIRMRGQAGWSEPLLFTNPEDRICHIEAHMPPDQPKEQSDQGSYIVIASTIKSSPKS